MTDFSHSFPHYRIQVRVVYAAVISVLFLKTFQGISKFVVFNHEEVPSLPSFTFPVKSLVTADQDFGKDPKPDAAAVKDFPLLIMGYYIMKLEKKSRVLTRSKGDKNGKTHWKDGTHNGRGRGDRKSYGASVLR